MKTFSKPNRRQQLLFAEVALNNFVENDSPTYIIDHFINEFDTSVIENQYNIDSWQWSDPLHPKTYIKFVCLPSTIAIFYYRIWYTVGLQVTKQLIIPLSESF